MHTHTLRCLTWGIICFILPSHCLPLSTSHWPRVAWGCIPTWLAGSSLDPENVPFIPRRHVCNVFFSYSHAGRNSKKLYPLKWTSHCPFSHYFPWYFSFLSCSSCEQRWGYGIRCPLHPFYILCVFISSQCYGRSFWTGGDYSLCLTRSAAAPDTKTDEDWAWSRTTQVLLTLPFRPYH